METDKKETLSVTAKVVYGLNPTIGAVWKRAGIAKKFQGCITSKINMNSCD
jgi:hypothetical protein